MTPAARPRRTPSRTPEPATLGDLLYWAYANLAMAHMAASAGSSRYGRSHYAVRARLYAGLRSGRMTVSSLLNDERLKMILPAHCAYCGSAGPLSIDHVFARARGGVDDADNAVWACRSCNSSKGKKDLINWYAQRGETIPLLLMRRYLKLCIAHVTDAGLLGVALANAPQLPFAPDAVPTWFPDPGSQRLWVVPVDARPSPASESRS